MAVQFVKIGHLRISATEIKSIRLDPAGGSVWVQIGTGPAEQVTGDDAQVIRAWLDAVTVGTRPGAAGETSRQDGSPAKPEPKKGTK